MGQDQMVLNDPLLLFDSIWNGQLVKDDTHVQDLRRLFLDNMTKLEDQGMDLEKRIKDCQSDLEQIEIVQESFQWLPVPPTYFQKFEKNPDLSSKFREKGNMEYKKDRLLGALRGYNLAIMFGRSKSQETGLAFANRSALFLQLKEIELALRDIDLAKENEFPSDLMPKLVQRKIKCESILEERKGRTSIKINDNDQNSKSKKFKQNENVSVNCPYFQLKDPSRTVLGAEKFVHIDTSDKKKGRRVIVDRDVDAGTLLLMDKPFVSILKKELTWDATHCQFCLSRILGGISCDHCTFSMYCDDECRQNGQKFHQYEHKSWAYLHSHDTFRRLDLLATRIVEILGPFKIYEQFFHKKIHNNNNNSSKIEPENCGSSKTIDDWAPADKGVIPGFNSLGTYDPSTYTPVHNLVSHSTKEGDAYMREVMSNCFKSLILTHLLQDTSPFFEQIFQQKNIDKDEEIVKKLFSFTASLILRHLQNIPFNAIKLSELRPATEQEEQTMRVNMDQLLTSLSSPEEKNKEKPKSVSFATAIFPLIAMCNHECSPNTVSVRLCEGSQNRSTMALVSLTSLKAQSEISITYGPLWSVHPFEYRQQLLLETYKFKCDCPACRFSWPIMDKMNLKGQNNFQLLSEQEKTPINGKELKKFESELEQVHQLILANRHSDALKRVAPCLKFFGDNFHPSFLSTQVAQQLFKILLMRLANGDCH